MKRTVTVKNLVFGEGIPKVCVPITGKDTPQLIQEIEALKSFSPDLVEWRADFCSHALSLSQLLTTLAQIREALKEIPLLFTFRTKKEGGQQDISPEAYVLMCREVIASGLADLLDVELFMGEEIVRSLVLTAHAAGMKVIVSSHDFEGTPSEEVLVERMKNMEKLGADLPKIAVMPQSQRDVALLLAATSRMNREGHQPVITMAMGDMGTVSRVCGEIFGSAMTFGTVSGESAPGQIEITRLKNILSALHHFA